MHELTKRAEKGEKGAMPALRKVLDENPDLVWHLGDFARISETVLMKKLSRGEDPVIEASLRRQFAAMREEVAGEDPSPLERLLAERVVATYMQLQVLEGICARQIEKPPTNLADLYQRHLDRAHRRHLSAIRTLAQVRKLLKPMPVAQINIAEQQVNVSGNLRRS